MATVRPWSNWKPYRFFPWVEWRTVALELGTCPGVPIDISSVWTERRWRKQNA